MADVEFKGASPNSQFLVGELPHAQTPKAAWWEGTGVSIAAHVLVLGVLIWSATHARQIINTVTSVPTKLDFIFLPQKGPGGGGGGRPPDQAPPRKAEIVAAKPVEARPIPKPADVPTPEVTVPIQTPQAVQTLPGSVSGLEVPAGTGSGSNGIGTGIGNGRGSGVGEGYGGGFGGGAYQIGNGVSSPQLIKEVKPNYTGDAMRAKLQGVVEMECVVLPDGTVDPKSIKITRSLDANFGLDQQAIIAVKQWRFRPGTFKGQPVPVIVNVELTFTLR
jgi:protein TonB